MQSRGQIKAGTVKMYHQRASKIKLFFQVKELAKRLNVSPDKARAAHLFACFAQRSHCVLIHQTSLHVQIFHLPARPDKWKGVLTHWGEAQLFLPPKSPLPPGGNVRDCIEFFVHCVEFRTITFPGLSNKRANVDQLEAAAAATDETNN